MKYMISIFLHRIYMDAMPVMPAEYNSSYIGIEIIYAIFLWDANFKIICLVL